MNSTHRSNACTSSQAEVLLDSPMRVGSPLLPSEYALCFGTRCIGWAPQCSRYGCEVVCGEVVHHFVVCLVLRRLAFFRMLQPHRCVSLLAERTRIRRCARRCAHSPGCSREGSLAGIRADLVRKRRGARCWLKGLPALPAGRAMARYAGKYRWARTIDPCRFGVCSPGLQSRLNFGDEARSRRYCLEWGMGLCCLLCAKRKSQLFLFRRSRCCPEHQLKSIKAGGTFLC